MGEFKGGSAPQCRKMGIYKPKAYFQGRWGKYNKIDTFRIIGQGKFKVKICFKILDYA